MATSAERRQQLEYHLSGFREIAENRWKEKITRWSYHIPAMVSATLIICQLANTVIFGMFALNFSRLYVLIDEYMLATNGTNMEPLNESEVYEYEGVNYERIHEIDLYQDNLWTMFVSEVIQLIFPLINIFLFACSVQTGKKKLGAKLKAIYLLCPALSIVLSISQACMIHVTLFESVYTIRFLLAKLLATLLVINKPGRLPIENYFECEFFNDDDIVKPPCPGTIHDQVVSPFTLNLLIIIHILPVIIFIYLIVKNLSDIRTEHLFLYIESVDSNGHPAVPPYALGDKKNRSLKDSLTDLLSNFEIKFQPRKTFHESIQKTHDSSSSKKNGHPNLQETHI